MKKLLPLSALCTLFISLNACSETPIGTIFPVPEDKDSVEKKLVDPSDYLVNYAVGDNSSFRRADGYKNGSPFMCYWSKDAAIVEDGLLKLKLYKEGDRYYGAEYRSIPESYSYGYYATSMKAAKCSGVVSSFFTYTNNPVWDEIDVEIIGNNTKQVQFNFFNAGNKKRHAYYCPLWFDSSEDFHEYGFEWLPDSITWYVDGIKVYGVNVDIPVHNQRLMMNVWNCEGSDWAGAFDESKLPVEAQYQWIAYIPAKLAAL